MAHIEMRRQKAGGMQLLINGIDYSEEVYNGAELVEVGEGLNAEVGLRLTFAVGRLDIDNDADVEITDRLPAVATQVRSMQELDEDGVVDPSDSIAEGTQARSTQEQSA